MKLVEVKTPKAALLLTEDEYLAALERGKAIKRGRELKRRLVSPKTTRHLLAPPLIRLFRLFRNEWSNY